MDNGGSDHSPRSGWTPPRPFPFNGGMNTLTTTLPGTMRLFAPFAAGSSSFGLQPKTMFDDSCRCHEATRTSRDRVIAVAADTPRVTERARTALASCTGLDWEGNAASLFRDRIQSLRTPLDVHDDDAAATARMAEAM